MSALIGTILCSSLLFLIFRIFPKFSVDTAQAIVFNYFTAFVTGLVVSDIHPDFRELQHSGLIPWLLLCGFLFISLFITMGLSSQQNGMGVTSVAVKMSLALSGLAFMLIHREALLWSKILGLILAIGGILLITYQKDTGKKRSGNIGMILYLFVGSAGLDVLLNLIKSTFSKGYPDALFTAFGFLFAGILGFLWLTIQFWRKKQVFHFRNFVAGIILGIPNFFSIYFLVRSYESAHWHASTILAIMNISIVALAAILGILIFRESATWLKLAGLLVAIGSILIMTI